jgi:hypothetical protein
MSHLSKKNIFFAVLSFMLFCTCNDKSDTRYSKLKKTKTEEIGKICVNTIIDVGRVKENHINIDIPVINCGTVIIKNFEVVSTCDCTTLNTIPTQIQSKDSLIIKAKIDISEEKKYFRKLIFLYGTFYPFVREIYVEGYKE